MLEPTQFTLLSHSGEIKTLCAIHQLAVSMIR